MNLQWPTIFTSCKAKPPEASTPGIRKICKNEYSSTTIKPHGLNQESRSMGFFSFRGIFDAGGSRSTGTRSEAHEKSRLYKRWLERPDRIGKVGSSSLPRPTILNLQWPTIFTSCKAKLQEVSTLGIPKIQQALCNVRRTLARVTLSSKRTACRYQIVEFQRLGGGGREIRAEVPGEGQLLR